MASSSAASLSARWQDDASVSACSTCGVEFGLSVRRHHCRSCGRIFCDHCSRYRATLGLSALGQPAESRAATLTATSAAAPVADDDGGANLRGRDVRAAVRSTGSVDALDGSLTVPRAASTSFFVRPNSPSAWRASRASADGPCTPPAHPTAQPGDEAASGAQAGSASDRTAHPVSSVARRLSLPGRCGNRG